MRACGFHAHSNTWTYLSTDGYDVISYCNFNWIYITEEFTHPIKYLGVILVSLSMYCLITSTWFFCITSNHFPIFTLYQSCETLEFSQKYQVIASSLRFAHVFFFPCHFQCTFCADFNYSTLQILWKLFISTFVFKNKPRTTTFLIKETLVMPSLGLTRGGRSDYWNGLQICHIYPEVRGLTFPFFQLMWTVELQKFSLTSFGPSTISPEMAYIWESKRSQKQESGTLCTWVLLHYWGQLQPYEEAA